MSRREALLTTRGLRVGYRTGHRVKVVLDDVELVARPGELTAMIGPNGTGKSTLLRTIAGLQSALGGTMRLGDADLDSLRDDERARVQAVVLTERVAPGALTARELAGLGRHPHTGFTGRLTNDDWAVVDRVLDAVGARELADRDLSELSDGERQRVMTARALAQEPSLLLMDEPSAFLDAPGRVELTGLVRDIAHGTRATVVMSTHEVELALRVADWIWLVDRAGVVHQGTPGELVGQGLLNAVFDSDQLRFDPVTYGFVLGHSVDAQEIVARLGAVNSYFCADVDPDTGTALSALTPHDVVEIAQQYNERIGSTELRVGISTWHIGLAARLWSLGLGAVVTDGVVLDLADARWDSAQSRLAIPHPRGWAEPDMTVAARRLVGQVGDALRPVHEAIHAAARMSPRLLVGNVASAGLGASRSLARAHPNMADRAEQCFTAVMNTEVLRGSMVPTAGGDYPWRRRSCCLYYRAADGGYCGECPLSGHKDAGSAS